MESKDWVFACAVDRAFLYTYHDPFVEYVSTSLRRQMADHILDLLQQDGALCIQRGETTMRNDDARGMVSFEETLRVRPLVRCKDCKYYVLARDGEACAMVCECSAVYGDGYGWAPQPDDYCSRGERKGGDE